ncbi:type II toxin-antitoxin system PemK/MazF family toxin [Streptomyces phaeolivaceus]|uniref:Type II toxin-antitoxin system PemK/MazF family toxin n=1 Tax=Streptomyces phaeolivaceus TaxID=2653200 RepID=A0A5P8K255_9ACTN|nr:type II toxin-antitoxin system PemK/MazF family toxin [Streptomyces phaeolivaceus]QFQ97333.1 type II toxin-antitoxin system PemK/MazF family toxin [Streptomyces phaeolivaceus]
MIRGSVYPVDLGDAKRGHEQRGKRFGIVLSDTPDTWSTVVIVPTSTSAQQAIFRPRLVIAGRETAALADQVRTIDTQFVCGDPVDHLTGTDMAQVEFALGRLLRLRINLDY